ncbi:MAG: PD-(D/E)XK nuclease family protein [Muribaculaceae bacterium]
MRKKVNKAKNVIRDVIVENRMYAGDYLTSNLGHEVINMFKAADGKCYLYLNPYGSFAEKWRGRVKYMLMIKYYSEDCVEVIGKAKITEDIYNCNNTNNQTKGKNQEGIINEIKYCGVSLADLFSDAEQQDVYVTFRAATTYKVKNDHRILIHYKPQSKSSDKTKDNVQCDKHKEDIDTKVKKGLVFTEDCIDVWLSETKLALQSLRQFYAPKTDNDSDYKLIKKIIEDKEYAGFWEKVHRVKISADLMNHEPSLFDICQIQNDENRISNAMAYFMRVPKYRSMWRSFFTEECGIELCDNYTVVREQDTTIKGENKEGDSSKKSSNDDNRGRIDLFISGNNSVLAIENKIKSGINRTQSERQNKASDKDQLDRYIRYLSHLKDVKEVIDNYRLVVLLPKYNEEEINQRVKDLNESMNSIETQDPKPNSIPYNEVKVVTYKELYDFLSTKRDTFKDDSNFMAFFNTIKRHTYNTENEYLYGEMMQKFYDRIRLAKQSSSEKSE